MKYLGKAILVSYHNRVLYLTQNANLRSSREAPHSSSMSNMAISPLSPFCPLSPFDDVFWDSAEAPPKVSNNLWLTHSVTCQQFWWLALKWKTSVVLFPWLPTTEEVVVIVMRARGGERLHHVRLACRVFLCVPISLYSGHSRPMKQCTQHMAVWL